MNTGDDDAVEASRFRHRCRCKCLVARGESGIRPSFVKFTAFLLWDRERQMPVVLCYSMIMMGIYQAIESHHSF